MAPAYLPACQVGSQLDWLSVMSYGAGPSYSPLEAFDAYRSLFGGKLMMGMIAPGASRAGARADEAWANEVTPDARYLASTLQTRGAGGLVLWSLLSQGTPSVQQLSSAVCDAVGKDGCDEPLFSA